MVGPDETFAPDHAFRDIDITGTFQIGEFGDRSSDTPGLSNVAIPEPSSLLALSSIAVAGATRRCRSLFGQNIGLSSSSQQTNR